MNVAQTKQPLMAEAKRLFIELSSVLRICSLPCFFEYLKQILLNLPSVLKAKSLAPADRSVAGKRRLFKVLGQVVSLDGALFGGAREIYGRMVYFVLPDFKLRPSDVVIDLGANAGVFTTLAARLCGKVIAVEAQSGFIPEIHSNAVVNNCADKVSVEFGIVGPSSGFFSNTANLNMASHFVERPPVISMSELIARHSLEIVNFVKVDIEGSEFDLFNGEVSWLSRVEKIVMEVHLEFGDVNKIVSVLKNNGFEVWLVNNDQQIVDQIDGTSGYLFAKHKSAVGTALSRTW